MVNAKLQHKDSVKTSPVRFLDGSLLLRRGIRFDFVGALMAFFSIILLAFFLFNSFASVCSVDGNSMNKTLRNDETILISRNFISLEYGDIVTIKGLSEHLIIKRIIALEGDKLVFRLSPTMLNRVELFKSTNGGEYLLLMENYLNSPMTAFGWGVNDSKRIFREEFRLAPPGVQLSGLDEYAIIIGKGECFVMGDNRGDSSDSRVYGLGKVSNIVGKMFYSVTKDSIFERILLFIYREREDPKAY